MKKLALLSLAVMISCTSGPSKRGAINLGNQPTAITLLATNNDLNLRVNHESLGTIVKFTPASGGSTITGIDSSPFDDGDMFMVRNESDTDSITFTNADTGSKLNNRMILSSGGAVVLPPRSSIWIELDSRAGSGTTPTWVQGPGHINSPTFNGTVTTSSASVAQGIETLDGTTGKIIASLSKGVSYLSFTGTKAFTLPNGTVTGTIHTFEVTSAGSTPLGTLTITTPTGSQSATHVFTSAGQILTLQWDGTGWNVIGKRRAGHQALVIGTTLTAGLDMAYTYDLSVTGSVVSSTTKALPNGSVANEQVHLDVTTASGSAAGELDFTGTNATGTNVGSAVNIGNAATDKSFVLVLQWDGARWQIIYLGTNTGVTISMIDMIDIFSKISANENALQELAA